MRAVILEGCPLIRIDCCGIAPQISHIDASYKQFMFMMRLKFLFFLGLDFVLVLFDHFASVYISADEEIFLGCRWFFGEWRNSILIYAKFLNHVFGLLSFEPLKTQHSSQIPPRRRLRLFLLKILILLPIIFHQQILKFLPFFFIKFHPWKIPFHFFSFNLPIQHPLPQQKEQTFILNDQEIGFLDRWNLVFR